MATSRRGRAAAILVVAALLGAACGGDSDGTEVLGIQIDRESESASDVETPTEASPSESPSATQAPTASPTVDRTPSPPPSPTVQPSPDPTPTEPAHPAEVADPGTSAGELEVWQIGPDGQAAVITQTGVGETYERGPDGTVDYGPDYAGLIDVAAVDAQNVTAACTAVATADDHRDLVVRGSLTVDLLVDDAVVATTTVPVDALVGAGTTATLAAMDPHGPVLVGVEPGDDVQLACRLTLA